MSAVRGLRVGSCALYLAMSTLSAETEPQRFESPSERATVVELFTSHGCSSCPPADEWLSRQNEAPELWHRLIPLAFHVDYWDYLGWRDRFASVEFSQRQRDYRRSGGLGSVYTPGVVVNGKEWRGWYRGEPIPYDMASQIGRLLLEVEPNQSVRLHFTPGRDWREKPTRAHLAILGNELESYIRGGENRGRTLRERFVVLAHQVSKTQIAPHSWRLSWPAFESDRQGQHAVVAWISSGEDPAPQQATGGWLR